MAGLAGQGTYKGLRMSTPLYNFRFTPEALWLLFNTILGSLLVSLMAVDFTSITDWKAWAIGFGFGLLRTIGGAVLTAASGGSFVGPGQKPAGTTEG